jgi:hypothetical protein
VELDDPLPATDRARVPAWLALCAGWLVAASVLEGHAAPPVAARFAERMPEGFGRLPARLADWSPRELRRLPGIGPTRALAIARARSPERPASRPEDFDRVPGIGPATVAAIRAWLAAREAE